MAINYHVLPSGLVTDPASYQGQLWLMLCQFECSVAGVPDQTIYDDGVADSVDSNGHAVLGHNPTIGVGFNLRAQLLPVMRAYFNNQVFDTNSSSTFSQDQDLMVGLKAIMAKSWSGTTNVAARTAEVISAINTYYGAIGQTNPNPNSFVLTPAQSQVAFNNIVPAFEVEVSGYAETGGYANIPLSNERLALMSLAWNSKGKPLDGKNLLGKGLLSALHEGDRAEAWFQIRYQSNSISNGNSQPGIAKRRYFESQLFGLYNEPVGSAIPPDEALQTYEMMSETTGNQTNRSVILTYENSFSSEVAAATSDYHQVLGITVQTLEQALQPAADALVQRYVTDATLNPWTGSFASTSFNSLDVQVAAATAFSISAQAGHDLVASHRDDGTYELTGGQDQNSLLIAQDGNDTLDASQSSANDALIGGSGDDSILGGTGNNYIVAGTGNDSIVLEGGNDTVILGDANDPVDGGQDTVDMRHDTSGNVDIYVGAGTHETLILGAASVIPTIYLATGAQGNVSVQDLGASAAWIASGEWYDKIHDVLLIQKPDPITGVLDFNADSKTIEAIFGNGSSASGNSSGNATHDLSLADLQRVAAEDESGGTTSPATELTLENFAGSSDLGITLGAAPPAPTAPGASNLAELSKEDGGSATIYIDNFTDSVIGSDTSATVPNIINGEGNATSIIAGNGNNLVFVGDYSYAATNPLDVSLNVVVIGGSGDQLLVGVGNGNETITGGNVGQDTTACDTMDGGGANAILKGGSQNSVIYGGSGADTLVAGSSDADGFNPFAIEIAGLSFWGNQKSGSGTGGTGEGGLGVSSEPDWSIPSLSDPENFQIILDLFQSDGTYAAPMGLLGSSLDSGLGGGSTTLPGSELIGATGYDVLVGNSGNDTLIGGVPSEPVVGVVDEVLVGGAGADVIYGGGGTEIIYADMSPGAVANWAGLDAANADTIYGGTGTNYIYGSGGNDVIVGSSGHYAIYTGNGNSHVTTGTGNSTVYGGTGNDTIVAEGNDNIQTGDGNAYVQVKGGVSTIYLGSGNDTIEAGSGNALIVEGSGHATFIIGIATGLDTIQANTGGTSVKLAGGLNESNLIVRDVNGNLLLSNVGDPQLQLQGYFSNVGEVSIQFADGTIWGASQILQASMTPNPGGETDTLIGSDGNDSIAAGFGDTFIQGTSGNNTLTGGAGDDTIRGGSGADTIEGGAGTTLAIGGTAHETYLFNLGEGSETISENTTSAWTDTLQFGAGIDPSQLTYSYGTSSNDLVIQLGSDSDSTITISNYWTETAAQHQIGPLEFSDGSTVSRAQILQVLETIDGTSGDDDLRGNGVLNYFDGKGGNDFEGGNSASDTFVFNQGYGHLEVYEDFLSDESTPVLKLGAGITASSLEAWTPNGSDLYLSDGVSGDQIFLLSGIYADWGVKEVQLADGSTLTKGDLIQIAINDASTTGSDAILGSVDADLYDGKGGDDTIVSGGGSDTFMFNEGYGHLHISDFVAYIDLPYAGNQNPVLKLGPGITINNLSVTADTENLILSDGIAGDEIYLSDMMFDDDTGSSESAISVVLADGTTLNRNQLLQMELASGTPGNDTLHGTSASELFDGKGGNDVEIGEGRGGSGNDTFVFNAGYGRLEIDNEYQIGEQPILQLGSGIAESSLKVMSDDGALYLIDGIPGDLIKIDDALVSSQDGVAYVRFSDGSQLTSSDLIQMVGVPEGTAGPDTLYGSNASQYFDGKGGSDFESGGGGNDTFIFNAGYGDLEISNDYNGYGQPILQLGAGITAATLHITKNADDLVLTDGIAGDQITLDEMGSNSAYGIALVQFSDGTSLTAAELLANQVVGTSGSDSLQGTSSADFFDGKGGADLVVGGGGNDTVIFNSGYGHLEFNETHTSSQQPILQLGAGIVASALHVTVTNNNLVLTDGINGDQITLDSMWSSSTKGVTSVQLADGTTLTRADLIQMEMVGTPGNDTIQGTSGDDYIDGDGGDDSIVGGGGNDEFNFSSGYGQLEISETYTSSQQPVLYLGGIEVSALHVTAIGTNLIITDGISGDQITLDSMLSGSTKGVAEIDLLDDGTSLTRSDLLQMEMTGTTGNDTLQGTSSADFLDGQGGNDSIVGNGGNDTFVFNSGYGQLEINESYSSSQQPVLQLGDGITASTLHVAKSGNNLLLTDGVSGDQVTLDTMSSSSTHGVATVQLADGTALTRAQLIQMETIGTTGNDTITGTSGAELIDGRGGNDSVVGSGGNDTFVFNSGYGHLEINESFTSGQQPILQLGTGITTASLHVTETNNNLLLTDGVSGDQVTLDTMWSSTTKGVASVHLADGTTLTRAQLLQMEMTGTTGNDTLQGTSGADLIDGKGGNDSVTGGGGNDTFVFNSGYGHLAISESFSSGQSPILQMGVGITSATLHVAKSGNDLVFTDGVTGDQITLSNMSSSSTSGVASVHLADGTILTRAQLIQKESASVVKAPSVPLASDNVATLQINSLIHAIASYTGNGGGGDGVATSMMPPVNSDAMLHAAA